MEDESTLRLETGRNAPWIDTGLELRVIDAHGRESTWPICRASMTIGRFGSPQASDIVLDDPGVAGRQAMLQYRNKKVMFLNLNDAKPATREGKAVGLVELVPGQEIVISGQRLQLVERQPAAACLVGYSPPFRGRRWLLHSGEHAVGRAGRRENQILINDRTVSREHAVLTADAQGYRLRVEASSAPTYLNGHPVEGEAALKDGDLLQFGNQLVRLQIGSASARASSMQTLPATVLYADVSNCEKLLAERPMDEMVRQMADYYEMVDRVVSEGSGRLTTYLGDAAVALFDDEAAAVQAALTLCRHIDQMNDLWRQVGQAEFEIGIGLHTGDIVVGDLSLGARSDFAAVGEQADLAAQIERQTRRKKERILLSATTAQGVGQRLALRSLGTSQINGTSLELFAPA